MPQDTRRKRKFARIILAYPIALIAIAVTLNLLVFDVEPISVALPSRTIVTALIVGALLLVVNHSWLMTSTELTRLRFEMHATPEEWAASGHQRNGVSDQGWQELERRKNAHANATENTVHFVLLASLVAIVTPVTGTAVIWILGFPVGRVGHAWAYLAGKDNLRGLFMSLSLVSLYGLASYLAVGLVL